MTAIAQGIPALDCIAFLVTCDIELLEYLATIAMTTEETSKNNKRPQVVKLDRALKLAEQWVTNMGKSSDDDKPNGAILKESAPQIRDSKFGSFRDQIGNGKINPKKKKRKNFIIHRINKGMLLTLFPRNFQKTINLGILEESPKSSQQKTSNFGGQKSGQSYHRKWENNGAKHDKEKHGNPPKNVENACYRCGMTGHWEHTCRTARHLVDLYQASLKEKGKNIESNNVLVNDDFNITYLDVEDFLGPIENKD
nr:uncharacterized protein LOC109192458 [Ipomoea batatas]